MSLINQLIDQFQTLLSLMSRELKWVLVLKRRVRTEERLFWAMSYKLITVLVATSQHWLVILRIVQKLNLLFLRIFCLVEFIGLGIDLWMWMVGLNGHRLAILKQRLFLRDHLHLLWFKRLLYQLSFSCMKLGLMEARSLKSMNYGWMKEGYQLTITKLLIITAKTQLFLSV